MRGERQVLFWVTAAAVLILTIAVLKDILLPFIAGIALYPGCQSDGGSRFYAPLLVLAARGDSVTPVVACERLRDAQPAGRPELRLVIYPYAPHTFDMALRDRTVLGMRLGNDAEADADARRQVVAFLAAHGLARRR